MRDFRQEKNKDAASKNAYVLLGQHRHELAAAFFVLGEPLSIPTTCSSAFLERLGCVIDNLAPHQMHCLHPISFTKHLQWLVGYHAL